MIVNAFLGVAVAHIQLCTHLLGVVLLYEAARTWVLCICLHCTEKDSIDLVSVD